MSRLKAKDGVDLRRIGDAVLSISKEVYRDPSGAFSSVKAEPLEDAFKDLFDGSVRIDRPMTRGADDVFEAGLKKGTMLRFHYDRTYDADGEKLHLVNILVPDLHGKTLDQRIERVKTEGADKPDQFDLDDFAAEALGMITILSCAG